MSEVQRLFTTLHAGHYKIYNLCAERGYDLEGYFEKVERFPFDDHNPCALMLIEQFCNSVEEYLAEHPDNVVGIHCKAGKGRTGLMICTYLLHTGLCTTAADALQLFARERTHNGKGVTIPSQIRWVHYYEQLLRRDQVVAHTYQITHIRLVTIPNFDPAITGGGCDPYFQLKVLRQVGDMQWKEFLVYNYLNFVPKPQKCYPSHQFADLDVSDHNLFVRGDVKIIFYDQDQYSADDKMFHLWFHTAFVERNYLVFEKSVIDKACKDKSEKCFDKDFKVEIFLHRVSDDHFDIEDFSDQGDMDEEEEEDEEEEKEN